MVNHLLLQAQVQRRLASAFGMIAVAVLMAALVAFADTAEASVGTEVVRTPVEVVVRTLAEAVVHSLAEAVAHNRLVADKLHILEVGKHRQALFYSPVSSLYT